MIFKIRLVRAHWFFPLKISRTGSPPVRPAHWVARPVATRSHLLPPICGAVGHASVLLLDTHRVKRKVQHAGLEPATFGLEGRHSTN